MENISMEEESLFTKIDPNLKDRARIYITEARLVKEEKINSMRDLVEAALHEFMINHPITAK
jgi:hypothetical protein